MKWEWPTDYELQEAYKAEKARLKEWHPWFAWYPVRLGPRLEYWPSGREICWLCTVDRKIAWECEESGWVYEYREHA